MSLNVYTLLGTIPCYVDGPKAKQDWESQFDGQNPGSTEAGGVAAPPAPKLQEGAPADPAPVDQVVEQPSPLEGKKILFLNMLSFAIESPRYAVSENLYRALAWGRLLFGGTSFAIYRRVGQPGAPFLVMATDEPLRLDHFNLGNPTQFEGRDAQTIYGRTKWERVLSDDAKNAYRLWAVVTAEGRPSLPHDKELWNEFHDRYESDRQQSTEIADSAALAAIFPKIDALLASGEDDDAKQAIRRLSTLNAEAFRLCDWEQKVRYLILLLEAWDNPQIEATVVEVFKALSSQAELEAVLEQVREKKVMPKLVNELDSQFWSLLAVLGERFGDDEPFTIGNLLLLLDQAGIDPVTTFTESTPGLWTLYPPAALGAYDRFLALVNGLGRSAGELLDSLKRVVTEGDKLVDGVIRLARLLHIIHLASLGDKQALEFLEAILQEMMRAGKLMGQQAYAVVKGMAVLKEGDLVVKRVGASLAIELASLCIGAAELKALLTSTKLLKELKWLRRFRGVLSATSLAGDVEKLAVRLEKVADALIKIEKMVNVFQTVDGLTQVLSLLPKRQLKDLAVAMNKVKMEGKEYGSFEELQQQHPNLAQVAAETLEYALELHQFGQEAGGLDEEVAGAYELLVEGGWTE